MSNQKSVIWKQSPEGRLQADYCGEYAKLSEFVYQVSQHAIVVNHHPQIEFHYKQVRLEIWSFDTQSLTEKDHQFCEAANRIWDGLR